MGIDIDGYRFLTASHRDGVSFQRTAMLGHQNVTGIGAAVKESGLRHPALEDLVEGGFADPLFSAMGADQIVSLDASGYEDASVVFDLNGELPEHLQRRFTAVLDGGTIEHVFDVKQALLNAMQLVEVGGHLLLITPTSGSSGHGFYQFSPELFWRVLSPDNGFVIERFLLKDRSTRRWYEVADPEVLGRRVEFRTKGTSYLYVCARRNHDVPLFESVPQQSDYTRAWAYGGQGSRRNVPPWLRRTYGQVVTRRNEVFGTYRFDREAFRPLRSP